MEQPIRPPKVEVSLSTTAREAGSRVSEKAKTLPLESDRQEVASRGFEEELHSRIE